MAYRVRQLCLLLAGVSSLCHCTELPDAHLKPFGWGNSEEVEELFEPLTPKRFFEEYAIPNKPVVMRGLNKVWPGFENWQTDEYFRSVSPEEDYTVTMEMKRGDPIQPSKYLEWKQFLKSYNDSQRRMLDKTPPFLEDDVILPAPLQCDQIANQEFLMGNKIWFGNNYTTSQVHKDAADNINCLVYGIKNYTIISPEFQKYVLFDRPNGLYSNMDVDSVDLNQYPGLENVQYLHSELHAGDCIFVPYKWIHQVRSYGRNIAVNIWWNYWKDKELDLNKCPTEHNPKWSIRTVDFIGWGDFENREAGVYEHIEDLLTMARKPASFTKFVGLFIVNDGNPLLEFRSSEEVVKKGIKEAFKTIDQNKDKLVTAEELSSLSDTNKKKVIKSIRNVLHSMRVEAEKWQKATKAAKKYPQLMDPEFADDEVKKILTEDPDYSGTEGLTEFFFEKVRHLGHDEL